jgi:hypothetical protein
METSHAREQRDPVAIRGRKAAAVAAALRILNELGVQLHPQKTRIVHVREGFELGVRQIRRSKLHVLFFRPII